MTAGEWLWTTAMMTGMGLEDPAVDEAFEIGGAPLRIDRLAARIELHDVGRLNEARRHAARQEEMVGALVVACADMAEAIDDTLVVEDAVGGDEVLDQRRIGCLARDHVGPQTMEYQHGAREMMLSSPIIDTRRRQAIPATQRGGAAVEAQIWADRS